MGSEILQVPENVADFLLDGEVIVASWRPSFRLFLRQFIVGVAVTSLLLILSFLILPLWQWLLVFVATGLLWSLVFEGWNRWRQRRNDHWLLSNLRLIYFNPQEESPIVAVRLDQITRISLFPRQSLRVRLEAGAKVVMKFLPYPAEIRQRILQQQAAFLRK